MVSQIEPTLRPSLEVRANVDAAAASLVLAYRPVLVERGRANDGRLVIPRRLGNLVVAAVNIEGAQVLRLR